MLKKLFTTGSIINPEFLNAIQEPISFSNELNRVNFFSSANGINLSEIGARDSIKDWEISSEPESTLGRSAHEGRILGVNFSGQIVYGPPSATKYAPVLDLDSSLVAYDTEQSQLTSTFYISVESGSFLDSQGNASSWVRTPLEVNPNTDYFLIYDNELRAATVLPGRSKKFILLAKFNVSAIGEVSYIDLRQNTYIDSLYSYSQSLSPTSLISTNYEASVWENVITDTRGGSFVVTLPPSPQDGDRIAISDATLTYDVSPIIIAHNTTTNELLQNGVEDYKVSTRGAHIELYYHYEFNTWRFTSPPVPPKDPQRGEFISCGGEINKGVTLQEKCPNLEPLPINSDWGVSLGTYLYDEDLFSCFEVYPLTTAIYSDGNLDYFFEPNAVRCGKV